jgi:hypothetical protein
MAETDKKIEAMEQEVSEQSANPQADAPKKNAVAAEPSHIAKMADYEDLGAAVVKPTDSNPDASKKINQVSGDAQQKNAGAADAMPKLKEGSKETEKTPEDKEDQKEMAHMDADKKKKDEMAKMNAMKKPMAAMKEPMNAMANMKASYKKEESDLDIKADVDALVGDSDLSEEFKQKAATIFEAAIKAKVKEESQRLQGEYETKLKEDTESHKAELVEKVDSYLNYVVEEWMQENKIAIERGIKGEIAEDFIGGLKKLFEDHYIDVPDEKYNVLEDQASKIEDLEKKLNEEIEKNVKLNKDNGELKKEEIIAKSSEDLTDVEAEKFNKLAEEVEYANEEDFTSKVKTIKESYFGKKEEAKSNDIDDVAVGDGSEQVDPADLTNSMAAYTAAISKTKDIKLSNK